MIGLFFPSHIKLEDIKILFQDEYEYQRVLLFIHKLISLHRIQEMYNDNKIDKEMVFIHSDTIRMILGDSYTSILKKLSDTIECFHFFIPKIQSKQYRIKGYKGFTILKFNKVRKGLLTIHHKLLCLNLDKKRFPIRYKISEITKGIQLKSNTYNSNGSTFEFLGGYTSSEDFLYAFNNNFIYDKIDSFGFRLYTKVTNLKKELRKNITFIGCEKKTVCEIDFPNSQFFFLAYAGKLASHYYPIEFDFINKLYEKYERNSDFDSFKEICTKGLFYDTFVSEFKNEYGITILRDDIKELMYVLVYGDLKLWSWKYNFEKTQIREKVISKNKSNMVLALYDLILKNYPSFLALMLELKSTKWIFNYSKKGMKTNNCLLAQRVESAVIFDSIANRLLQNGITKFTTVHDSFICLQEDKNKVLKIIDEVLFELSIPTPKLR